MNTIACLIQTGGSAAECEAELEQRLRQNHADQLNGAEVAVTWWRIGPGLMFTGGEPSRTAVLTCTMDGPMPLPQRESYMRAVCDLWTEITGCTDHEIVVSITETGGEDAPHDTKQRS